MIVLDVGIEVQTIDGIAAGIVTEIGTENVNGTEIAKESVNGKGKESGRENVNVRENAKEKGNASVNANGSEKENGSSGIDIGGLKQEMNEESGMFAIIC